MLELADLDVVACDSAHTLRTQRILLTQIETSIGLSASDAPHKTREYHDVHLHEQFTHPARSSQRIAIGSTMDLISSRSALAS